MSDLPPGWSHALLPEMVAQDGAFSDGDWVETKDQDPNGDVRLIQLADVGDGSYRNRSSRFLTRGKAHELGCTFLRPGDVLIARMPDPLGRACIFPGDSKTSVTVVDVCVVRPGSEAVNPRWLMYTLNAPQSRNAMAALEKGTTRKRVSRGNLARIPMPVPPLAEQERIVAAIEEQFSRLDDGVVGLERIQHKLKLMRSALLRAAVNGDLSAAWRASCSSAVIDERAIGVGSPSIGRGPLTPLPVGWRWADLGDLIADGPQNGLYLPASRYGRGTPILRINDFQNDWTQRRNALKLVEGRPGDVDAFSLRIGDLVINRVNSMSHLGKSTVVPRDLVGVLFESNMMRLRLCTGVMSEYIALYLRSDVGRSALVANAKQAVNQASINQRDVRLTRVAVPPSDEQREIVALYDAASSSLAEIADAVLVASKRVGKLRHCILAAAFSGKLVSQSPNDESASILLQRIASDGASFNAPKSTKVRRPLTTRPKVSS